MFLRKHSEFPPCRENSLAGQNLTGLFEGLRVGQGQVETLVSSVTVCVCVWMGVCGCVRVMCETHERRREWENA